LQCLPVFLAAIVLMALCNSIGIDSDGSMWLPFWYPLKRTRSNPDLL